MIVVQQHPMPYSSKAPVSVLGCRFEASTAQRLSCEVNASPSLTANTTADYVAGRQVVWHVYVGLVVYTETFGLFSVCVCAC